MKTICFLLTSIFCIAHFCQAEEFGTAADAESLVKKAVAHISSAGKETAYADFTAQKPEWIIRDVYVVVYDFNGKALAHGQNAKQVGKDLLEYKDPDGKAFIKERVELAKTKGKFWQDYKFTDPVTKKILPKSAYCEAANDVIVCAGIYKR
jgi:cytochrome c